MFRLDENRVIDATLSGGLARYINHSCYPNCVAENVQIDRENKILIITNRRVSRGEEVKLRLELLLKYAWYIFNIKWYGTQNYQKSLKKLVLF